MLALCVYTHLPYIHKQDYALSHANISGPEAEAVCVCVNISNLIAVLKQRIVLEL